MGRRTAAQRIVNPNLTMFPSVDSKTFTAAGRTDYVLHLHYDNRFFRRRSNTEIGAQSEKAPKKVSKSGVRLSQPAPIVPGPRAMKRQKSN